MIDIKRAKKAFDEYVNKFDMNNKKICLKYNHTYRVCEQSLAICKSLNLNEEDTDIAFIIALLHDIGRFEQAKIYDTFDDLKSIDHADFGCTLLFENGLIREFIEDDKYDEIIRKSVFLHNKYSIDDGLNERELLHAKIIRDADKIDIIYNVVFLESIEFDDDSSKISIDVRNNFNNEKLIDIRNKKTKNDSILTMFAFVFDLNFIYSFKYFKENDFINKMYDKLKNKEIFKEYVDKLNEYIERKC